MAINIEDIMGGLPESRQLPDISMQGAPQVQQVAPHGPSDGGGFRDGLKQALGMFLLSAGRGYAAGGGLKGMGVALGTPAWKQEQDRILAEHEATIQAKQQEDSVRQQLQQAQAIEAKARAVNLLNPQPKSMTQIDIAGMAAGGDETAKKIIELLHPKTEDKPPASYQEWKLAVENGDKRTYPEFLASKTGDDAGISSTITIDTPDGPMIKQFNPRTKRYDIDAGKAFRSIGEGRAMYDASGQLLGFVNSKTAEVTKAPPGTYSGFPQQIPSATQDTLANMKSGIEQIGEVLPEINRLAKSFGPLSGRVKLAEIEKLGGLGASKAQIDVANRLHRLLTTQAFANGGKQLTETERKEFVALLPSLSDTFDQAIIKANNANSYLKRQYGIRLDFLTPRQKEMLGDAVNANGSPSSNASAGSKTVTMTGPGGTFQVPIEKVEKFKANGYK